MVTEINHDSFCFNTQRVTRLQLDERLSAAVAAQASLERLAQWKGSAQPRVPHSEFLETGQVTGLSASADLRPAIEQSLVAGNPLSAVLQMVDRTLERFRSECATRASGINVDLPPATDYENPYGRVATRAAVLERLAAIRDRAAAERAVSQSEAMRNLDRFNRLAAAAAPQIMAAGQNRLDRRWRWVFAHAPAWLGPVAGAGGSFMIGQDGWTVALATAVGATIGIGLDWFRHSGRAPGAADEFPLRVARPAVDLLAAYAAALRSAHLQSSTEARAASLIQAIESVQDNSLEVTENDLAAQASAVPSTPFVEVRPGCVQLTGPVLVKALAKSIGEAVSVYAADPVLRPQLEYHLKQNLELLARSAMTIRPDVSINRSLCPEFLSIGLPEGTKDPLVPFVRRTFPGAGIITGSAPDSIEIIYRANNLSRGQLAIHARSSEAYEKATTLERSLWHFPRRIPALSRA